MKRIQAGFSRQASIGKQAVWTCACVLSLLLACFSTPYAFANTLHWTGSVDTNWFTAGNWNPAGPPQANDTVIVNAGTSVSLTNATPPLAAFVLGAGKTLTISGWDSSLTARELAITGTVTHAANLTSTTNSLGEWVPEHRVLIRGSNLTISATGKINTDARGYPGSGKGPGYGPGTGAYSTSSSSQTYGGGASYGGLGGHGYYTAFCGLPYGTPEDPWQPGSSGANLAGAGGGAIRIELDGHLQMAGTMSANAAAGTAGSYGGSSGGAVYVSCRTLAGAGQMQAKGSKAGVNGGSGGGGRIALHFDATAQDALGQQSIPVLDVTGVAGGKWFHSTSLQDYAMGTIYLTDAGFFRNGWPQWYGWLHVPTNRLEVSGNLTLSNCKAALATVRTLAVAGDLTLKTGATLIMASDPTASAEIPGASLDVAGNFVIESKGEFHPWSHPTNGASVRVSANNITVASGGIFDASGRGFRGGSDRIADDPDLGDGAGYGSGRASRGGTPPKIYGGGGSYGGLGGDGYAGWRGDCYGTPEQVMLPGSGGAGDIAGYGGGLVWLEVNDRVQIDGLICADGDNYAYTDGPAGGGSGGGVSIRSQTISGSGKITVNGGKGQTYGGVGGGGRIALHYDPVYQAAVVPPKLYCELVSGSSGTIRRSTPYEARMGTLWVPDLLLLDTNWENWSGWLHLPTNHIHVAGDLSVTRGWAALATVRTLEIDGDLVLGGSGSLCLDPLPTTALSIPGARVDVGGELVINNGGTLYVRSHPTNGAPLKVIARNVTVAAGGLICGDERGYFGREQPWPAYGPGAGIQDSTTHGSGAGHGGVGGYGYPGNPGGVAYGRALAPLEPGSGGGGDHFGGHGGATVWIQTPGQLRIDGTISANGGVFRDSYSGSGSGGGILLNARTIVGASTGMIRADGANGNQYGGGSAGGRIACWRRISPELATQLISGTVTNFAQIAVPTTYEGTTSVIGGTGYTHASNLTYPKKAGDGTVVWLSPHYTLFQIR